MLRRTDLLRLLETESASDGRLVEAVAALSVDELPLKSVASSELRAIYERRRLRMPDTPPLAARVNRLLLALAGYDADEVSVITMEADGQIFAVWLTQSADSVLAILAGDDRR